MSILFFQFAPFARSVSWTAVNFALQAAKFLQTHTHLLSICLDMKIPTLHFYEFFFYFDKEKTASCLQIEHMFRFIHN